MSGTIRQIRAIGLVFITLITAAALLPAGWSAWRTARAATATPHGGLSGMARPGEIPCGEWAGEGVFVYDIEAGAESPIVEATRELVRDLTGLPADEVPVEGDSGDGPNEAGGATGAAPPGDGPVGQGGDAAKRKTIERRYRTQLSIQPEEVDDRKILVLTIRSQRGPLPDLENETRLLLAVEKVKEASHSISVYKIVGFAFNPPSDATTPQIEELGAAAACTCITRGDVTVLQIRYMDNFVDTFRFEGERVEKTGVFGSKSGLIHWVEEMRER